MNGGGGGPKTVATSTRSTQNEIRPKRETTAQKKAKSETMNASSQSNNDASQLYLGGLWIEHSHDGNTVCSDITSDHTAAFASISNGKALGEDSLGTLPDGSVSTPPSGVKKKTNSPSTPNTAQSTPSRASPPFETVTPKNTVQPSSSHQSPSPLMAKQLPLSSSPSVAASVVASKKKAPPTITPKLKTTGLVDDGPFTEKPATNSSKTAATKGKAMAKMVAKAAASDANNNKAANNKPNRKQTKLPLADMDVPSNQNHTEPPSTNKKKPASSIATSKSKKQAAKSIKTVPSATKDPPRASDMVTTPSSPTSSNNGAGLSELSKQLRVQRAKNEHQHNEIARLERQLKILSDLKGVSVMDLRHSLESACQQEAHAELRNQVLSLQAQLEALQMQRDSARRRASTATNEAANQKIATLQLKIGELEEVDQSKEKELHSLYKKLQEQQVRATRLEKNNQHQQAQLQELEQASIMHIQNVEQMRSKREELQHQVAELTQKLQDQQAAQKLEAEMRGIEQQIAQEKERKAQYIADARRRASGRDSSQYARDVPVNRRLSNIQLQAIQGVVGHRDGTPSSGFLPPTILSYDNSTATSTGNTGASSLDYFQEGADANLGSHVFNFSDMEHEDDDSASHWADDASVHTVDALKIQGMSEEQAKEFVAKDEQIANLYTELRQHATKASQLERLVASQKAQMESFIKQLNENEDILNSTKSSYDFAKSEHDSLYKRFCDVELQLTIEQEKVEGLESQLNARLHENNLRNDQFKCRFQVQNERIADLEQQQQSLYAAFELLQQEVSQQDNEHLKLRSNLDEADSEVARHLLESDKKKGSDSQAITDSSHTSDRHRVSAYASLSDSQHSLTASEREFQQMGLDHPMRMAGFLWKLDKLKGWKRRFFVLYGSGGVYHMTYSDGPRNKVKGRIEEITMGVSTVAETNKSIKKPFSFVLHVDPLNHGAPVLYAAAISSDDFSKWMTALKNATIRPEDSPYILQTNLMSFEAQQAAELELSQQLRASSTRDLQLDDPESQVEVDRLMAMRMNIQNQSDQAFA